MQAFSGGIVHFYIYIYKQQDIVAFLVDNHDMGGYIVAFAYAAEFET